MTIGQRLRVNYRSIVSVVCAIVAAIVGATSGGTIAVDGLLYDLALAKLHLWGFEQGNQQAPVVVIGLDARTLEAPELRDRPRVFFGRPFAELLDALFEVQARVVGFDIVFAYDSSRSNPELDRPFREALARHAEKTVLGRSLRIEPVAPFRLQVPDDAIGLLELPREEDGVTRRVPASVTTHEQGAMATLPAVMLQRIGLSMPDMVLLGPTEHLEAIPSYSLIDVLRCARTSMSELRRAFGGKLVIVGTTLPEEDRRIPPSRFITPAKPIASVESAVAPCTLKPVGASNPADITVPGVFIHAAAVQAVISGRMVATAPFGLVIILAVLVSASAALTGLYLSPLKAATLALGGASALFLLSTALLALGLWQPVGLSIFAVPTSVGVAYVARFLFEERRRRWVQRVFGHYLAPVLVDQLAAAEKLPELGGERREVTVMFADLSGFTSLSGRIPAAALMNLTNQYLTVISEEIDKAGGYVDKFIGDAVMAVWGAPAYEPSHARKAVGAALTIARRIADERMASLARGEEGFWIKIGINSGPAVVGNAGSPRRLSYTVVGETVNLAARFESLPSDYGCMIVIGESTAEALDGAYRLCNLDLIKVKGATGPVRIYEPFPVESDTGRYLEGYARALSAYRARRFQDAQRIWLELSYPGLIDPKRMEKEGERCATPNRVMAARACSFIADPPPTNWYGEWLRESK